MTITTTDMDKAIARLDRDEQRALELGDLSTAIKLNWLLNAVRFDGLDTDSAEFNRQCIVLLGRYTK